MRIDARSPVVLTVMVCTLSFGVLASAGGIPGGLLEVWGPRFTYDAGPASALLSQPRTTRVAGNAASAVRYWNEVLLDANAIDHTPPASGESRVFGEQLGPGRTSLAFAVVQVGVFEAVNAVAGGYRSYTNLAPAPAGASMEAAIAQAAHDTLVAVYPSQADRFDRALAGDLDRLAAGRSRDDGVEVGRRAAAGILALHIGDGSDHPEQRIGIDFQTSNEPGKWRQDPIARSPLALGARWGSVAPLVIPSAGHFRTAPPPSMSRPEYALAYNEVQQVGGDGASTPTLRTADQTIAGIYWAYDGTPGLGTPPRLYNQIAVQIAAQRGSGAVDLARMLALVNVAMSDAGIACWESKYFYQVWRPVTGIRESDPGSGPTGRGDGNLLTLGNPGFSPLGAPASNLRGPNFTPPFPAYPSGHSTFGSAVFQTLRNVYGTDAIAFTFVSDELNGTTRDNQGRVRPRVPRSFTSLSHAEEENGQSRIYLGIHWSFDKTAGRSQGRRVADYVFTNAFTPE